MAKKGTNAMPCAEHRFADGHVETESVLLDRLRHYRVVATVDDAPATPDPAFVQRLLDERAPGQAEVTGFDLVVTVPRAPSRRRPLPQRQAAPGRRRRPCP
ncbi:hypothetical protein [Streptomyces parvulus]|uniref:hypothetical protein n=1 Tax=Streptomyces parvulus TaxID=146923 RepID=UPI0036B6B3A8